MPILQARATENEKENVRRKAIELGLTEGEFIRQALHDKGVEITVKKAEGAPIGNKNNKYSKK